ncbi:MAG TPA: hypothetical protein VGN61_10885 [Verrucomicrobiae bacterium]
MKNPIIAIKRIAVLTGLALSIGAGGVAFAEEIIPPSSFPYGLSYEEWSAKWWQWSLSLSTNDLQIVGVPDICTGAASSVRFLAGVYIPGAGGLSVENRKITISDQTPLFFPILSVWVDNSGCPSFTSFTADELAAQAAGEWSAVTVTSCTIDGAAVPGLTNPTNSEYLVQAPPFSYTTAEKHNVLAGLYGAPCIPGGLTIYPAVADGVYLMVAPLSRGKHTIHFVGIVGPASAPFVKDDVTYEITVERDAIPCGR